MVRISQEFYDECHDKEFAQAKYAFPKELTGIYDFAKGLNGIENEEKAKSVNLKESEEIFVDLANYAFMDGQNKRKKGIQKVSTNELNKGLNYLKEEIENLYNLNKKYLRATKERQGRHPDYEKYVQCVGVLCSEIEEELALREDMLGEFDGRVF